MNEGSERDREKDKHLFDVEYVPTGINPLYSRPLVQWDEFSFVINEIVREVQELEALETDR